MDALSIVNVAYPFGRLDADPIGGAEQVVTEIDRALVDAGHSSSVVAQASSRVRGALIGVAAPAGPIDDRARGCAAADYRQALALRLARGDVDAVHLHGVDFAAYLPEPPTPVIVTLHLPLSWYPPHAVVADDRLSFVCVSRSQRASARTVGGPAGAEARLSVVENGVPLDRYRPAAQKSDFALMLGRVCPEKGFDAAIRAARRARTRLVMAGKVFAYAEHSRYLRERIAPLLDDDRRFVGPIAGAAKCELLSRARCVLIPSQVDETSSLVAMEALASGTPVIAFRRGALPEIVEDTRTGFLVDTEAQMADAIAAIDGLCPDDCRAAAESRFSAAKMTQRYFDLYARSAAQGARRRSRRTAQVTLQVEEIADDAALARLADDWGELCDASAAATPFQHPAWLLAARRHLPGDAQPYALAVRRGARLAALLPLQRSGDVLTFIGAGVSDYHDLVCATGLEAAVVSALAEHLSTARPAWRVLELDALRGSSPLTSCAWPNGVHGMLTAAEAAPALLLPAGAAPGNLGYDRGRLARAGDIAWRSATPGNVQELLDALIALHGARWTSRGQTGALADGAVQRFHRDAAAGLARSGLLRMYALACGTRTVAVLYGFAHHRRCHFYLSGFDPEFARFSPGALVIEHAIAEATAEGDAEFDFLRGREPYKYRWGARDRPLFSRRVWHA